ncbi:hypothetical protein NSK_005036 [Nannochloropsis salina CCMP1776]|uniref:Acyltransferase n=1 Tax=Nannochloropsis salina CCMP1776 TaxID=1027361 RepID=A0A4D9CX53_9STRA|nr:hypothetical protein NSK_005036 [Nannochloropsis salina CCMP1776]|eukprot:TFJ83941.1 hypothetical protein NSK_005036 [Nannochloropsis salina CCMP1776]
MVLDSKTTDGESTDPAKATEEKRVPAPLRERKGKKQEGKDLRTPSSNLKPARSPTEVDWSSFPEGSYTRFGHGGDWWTFLKGTLAILTVWATWLGGGTSPVWMAWLYMHGYRVAFWILLGPLLYPLFLPVPAWPAFVRFVLDMAGYFKGGAAMYVENSFKGRNVNGPIMLAMHPHGIMPHSFLLNGAGRIHAQKPEFYLPPHYQDMSLKSTGVAEPLLFRIPLISAFLYFFGCAEPASKAMMHNILERQVPFGILVGGSEEILLMEYQRENVYILERKGFIKYALQHGYTIALGYLFGESNLYHTITWGRKLRLALFKRFKIPLFFARGRWFFPLLPERATPLNAVVGNPIDLPRIADPTQEDIDKFHAIYIEKLTDLFERNKAAFGYPDRELHLF